MLWAEISILIIGQIIQVYGVCQWHVIPNEDQLNAIKCIGSHPNEVLVIKADESENYSNVHSLEIKGYGNVTLLPGIFMKATDMQMIMISEIDNLYLDPGLAFPKSLKSFVLSQIGFLEQWLAPEPNAALLSSINSLQQLNLENVTVRAPTASVTSTFIDLPIAKVFLSGVNFIGTMPEGALEFHPKSLTEFYAINSNFGDVSNGTFHINSSGYAGFVNCTFRKVESDAVKVAGKYTVFLKNSFLHLEDTNAVSVYGKTKLVFSSNTIKTIAGSRAIDLKADKNVCIAIHENELQCSYFSDIIISQWYNSFNSSVCNESDQSLNIPVRKNYCVHANGKKESILLEIKDSINLFQTNGTPVSVCVRGLYQYLFLLLFSFNIILSRI